ncbi:MAG TPA: cytochrome c3 family protein [Gemmatimonadales bacterium]|nr:cytochrome c3 family protein [Gemmatimonadales bacterium]
MLTRQWGRLWIVPLLFLIGACTSETIVFRDREPFNPPPDSVNGFLGLFSASTNQTTCGNCHVGHQRDWQDSPHADAFETLESSGSAQAFCYGCHTVSENGNVANGPAGWNVVQDSAYHNVQCESCHGPGLDHVTEPDLPGNVPLAHLSQADPDASCASCHSGTHHPFVDEWEQSGHAQIIASPAGRTECQSCHEGRGALRGFNANFNYAERNGTENLPIVCGVCHDPHGSENEAELRFSISNPDPEQNLCMRCHIRRVEPGGGTHGGSPHAPQGAVLLGTAGYRPAGFAYDTSRIFTSHASERNPRLCAGCHVESFEVTDALTGDFVINSTGHLFKAIPCVDANGQPLPESNCAYDNASRRFNTCAAAGCHASEDVAVSALTNLRDKLGDLADAIWVDVNDNETIDVGIDTGYLPQIKAASPGEFAGDTIITAAEGAFFNVKMIGEERYANGDRSLGVHNPFLSESLLRANIQELVAVYGLAPPPVTVQRILETPMQGTGPQSGGITRLIRTLR